jgi:GTP-binding protein|tara:strand:- start:121 stop:540 length:420 start_codon:yes stop_codon:yes gene_type:complete
MPYRVLVHVIRGDSEDPVGDFQAINEELRLFNPELVEKPQVVVINKIDIPEVEVYVDDLTKELKKAAGHSRVVGISALAGSNVKMLMQRVRKMVDSLPEQESYNLYTDDKEERVSFEALEDLPGFDTFKVIMDDDFPGK